MSDGKTFGGAGQLIDAAVDKINTYHGYAFRNNKDKN